MQEEIRVLTDNPYEFEDDDEARFRDLLPYEAVVKQQGTLCMQPHGQQVRRRRASWHHVWSCGRSVGARTRPAACHGGWCHERRSW